MTEWLWPVLFALFLWWFSTGAIIWLDGLKPSTFKWSMAGATIIAVAALYGLHLSASDTSLWGAYLAFGSALLFWGWFEISFYMGYVTGTRKVRCRPGCSGWPHFWHALQANIWHELAILGGSAVVLWLSWDAPNQVGLWTFVILWWMHESARLNVLLGVRNVNEHFLPDHLDFLKGFLTKKPMNLLFPVSVTVSTVIAVLLGVAAWEAASGFERAGFVFLTTMMVIAIAEHWFLILPLPAERMWNWSLEMRKGIALKGNGRHGAAPAPIAVAGKT
jgi:putative photosynthetic complex assembly protein 2